MMYSVQMYSRVEYNTALYSVNLNSNFTLYRCTVHLDINALQLPTDALIF